MDTSVPGGPTAPGGPGYITEQIHWWIIKDIASIVTSSFTSNDTFLSFVLHSTHTHRHTHTNALLVQTPFDLALLSFPSPEN